MFLLIFQFAFEAVLFKYFNTSHVSINPAIRNKVEAGNMNFNTSHVSINQFDVCKGLIIFRISIHLMFLLIPAVTDVPSVDAHFNTSHVSINRLVYVRDGYNTLFQYISCFY